MQSKSAVHCHITGACDKLAACVASAMHRPVLILAALRCKNLDATLFFAGRWIYKRDNARSKSFHKTKENIMVFNKRNVSMAAVVAAIVAIVLATQIGASFSHQGAMKLEGAWVARVTSMNDEPFPFVSQWTYVFSPDASGRRATLHGTIDVGFGPSQPSNVEYNTPLIGEAVQTGPDTAVFNACWYKVQQGGAGQLNQILSIGTVSGEAWYVAEGKFVTTHHFAIYLPSSDADGDGIPDEGSFPVSQFMVTTQDTRIPSPVW